MDRNKLMKIIIPVCILIVIITSFTPCSLSSIPLVIGKAFWLSVTFATGVALTFTVLGVIASFVGY